MGAHLVLLAVHAHPDDESLGTGGTLARYAAQGVETVLVCATGGEEGEIQNPDVDPCEAASGMAALRLRELDAACHILGIGRRFLLGYRDSGMEGRPANAHPLALRNADLEEATAKLVRIVREVRPQVVLTYNEWGLYGHPDHIAVNRITLSAWEASGDPARFPETPHPPWRPQRLFYTAIPRSRLLRFREMMAARGESIGFDIESRSTPDDEITTRIDVGPYLDTKLRAIHSHRSQIGPGSLISRMPEPLRTEALSSESYVCVRGCSREVPCAEDLFEGIGRRMQRRFGPGASHRRP